MAHPTTGKQFLKLWFDQLERRLTEDAHQAGLLGHPTMTGNAREFFVTRVLKSFLPSNIRVGTGKVIGADSMPSKQVDIVVFDGRFPAFDLGGQSLFPIEGVICTIEVKSRLDTPTLHQALDNCFSVAQCGVHVLTNDTTGEQAARTANALSESPELLGLVSPRTYIFGFEGLGTPDGLNKGIRSWWSERGNPSTGSRPFLPSVVVSGGAVGIIYGDPIRVEGAELRTENRPGVRS